MSASPSATRLLPRLAALTVGLLYAVVLAGSIVRATGSGMGCPDWPRCFGRLIPPVDVSRIPPEFMETFLTEGHGNLLHTWIEWINRLFGAVSGLAALATLVCALAVPAARRSRLLMGVLVLEMILFGTVAWLGKVVVDSSLLPWMVTVHVMVAVAVISAAIAVRHLTASPVPVLLSRSHAIHLIAALVAVVIQTALGTQVREAVDHLPADACCDGRLEESLGTVLMLHRGLALLTAGIVGSLWFRLRSWQPAFAARALVTSSGWIVISEYLAGVVLVRLHLPAWIQPVHLFLALVLHGVLLSLLLRVRLQPASIGSNLSVP